MGSWRGLGVTWGEPVDLGSWARTAAWVLCGVAHDNCDFRVVAFRQAQLRCYARAAQPRERCTYPTSTDTTGLGRYKNVLARAATVVGRFWVPLLCAEQHECWCAPENLELGTLRPRPVLTVGLMRSGVMLCLCPVLGQTFRTFEYTKDPGSLPTHWRSGRLNCGPQQLLDQFACHRAWFVSTD